MKNKKLLIGFLFGIVLCVLCCISDYIESVLFATVVPFFFAQLWLLRKTRKTALN